MGEYEMTVSSVNSQKYYQMELISALLNFKLDKLEYAIQIPWMYIPLLVYVCLCRVCPLGRLLNNFPNKPI